MKQKRPINLAIASLRFPLTAIVSILHRLSGLALFFLIPLLLWSFSDLMSAKEHFDRWIDYIHQHLIINIILWLLFTIFSYHLLAGIRHLLTDIGIGESIKAGHWSAKLVLIVWLLFSILLGISLCLHLL